MSEEPGVGPAPAALARRPRLDPELLAAGDRRNVADRYRYWRTEAIAADLDTRRHPFHVAVENWQHDLNIGAVVRNANAFLAAEVHIVGRRRWNRRGAMVTDRYQHVRHHPTLAAFAAWAAEAGVPVLGVDNLPGSVAIDGYAAAAPLRAAVRPGGPRACRTRRASWPTPCSPSASSARPARSTPRPPRRWRCTSGCGGTPRPAAVSGAAGTADCGKGGERGLAGAVGRRG